MTMRARLFACGLLAFWASATPAVAGIIHNEINSGATFGGGAFPEVVGSGVDRIIGTISGGDQGDLYRVYFSAGGPLTILGRRTSGSLTPALFLFDGSGAGILADASEVAQAILSLTISPGTYYIGFGDFPLRAIDTLGQFWDASTGAPTAPPGAFGTLERLRNTGTVVSPGDYSIRLSMDTGEAPVAVPEPGTLPLLGLGLVAFAWRFASRRSPRNRVSGG